MSTDLTRFLLVVGIGTAVLCLPWMVRTIHDAWAKTSPERLQDVADARCTYTEHRTRQEWADVADRWGQPGFLTCPTPGHGTSCDCGPVALAEADQIRQARRPAAEYLRRWGK